jgi:hypothetical protein
MKHRNEFNKLFITIVAIAVCLACGSGNQTEEANKIVDSANKKLDQAKELYSKTETRNTKLFNANVQTVEQLQAYKSGKSDEAKAIVEDYETVSEMLKDISKQYDEVSRMNLTEKYKDYAKLKSDEYAKRSEAINVRKGNALAFMEIDDYKTMTTKFDDNNAKSDRLFKDAEDIGAKAKKLEEENKDMFRQV